ncbi:efflux RND transporter periplasmic adaptor subunit [Halopseudomonas maritima]|uniref:efflux RND transporter periplasmic adaptor subunit n=1 Tax=Halopseudomonas maritima TaxID=2918528 RepID=UPI001EEC5F15|nr:efflux RND transporter periplasmic adaptor subunit [Halopseudomonas maritima]UJJ32518.1 efflux RND transporter periplasmic adaptor subunit [Halopseudomonas maritima]
MQPQDLALLNDFTGQVSSPQEVELRARVSGTLLEKHFVDGAQVEAGDLLFTIDDRDLQARLLDARASLTSAQSSQTRARLDVDRYQPLLATQAIARQVYDNAVATLRSASSQVENAKAAVEQAELEVEYAVIRSPVSGRIGAAEADVGDLISAGTTLLAKVSTVDLSWVYFNVSESALLAYEKAHGSIEQADAAAAPQAKLFLSNGQAYEYPGEVTFSDRAINTGTGTIRLRAEFPNPQGTLRPGMFARVQLVTEQRSDVIAVPDKAVSQLLNSYFVVLADEGDVARQVEVKVGPRQGGLWIIASGLKAGDRVVVEGIQKARDGAALTVRDVTEGGQR